MSDTRDLAGLGPDREPGSERRLWHGCDTQLAALLISLTKARNRLPLNVDFHYSVGRADFRVKIALGRSRTNLSRNAKDMQTGDQQSCQKHLKRQCRCSGRGS